MPASDGSTIVYPLLGEPPVVEFVNTLYADADGVTDFLATVDLARGWFGALTPVVLTDVDQIDEPARVELVDLRDAIRIVFAGSAGADLDVAAAVLERAVNASPPQFRLTPDERGLLARHTVYNTATPAGAAALLADAAITIASTPGAGRVVVCDRPACNMRYFQQHRRRRYCNPACANSDRQARFQQRHTS